MKIVWCGGTWQYCDHDCNSCTRFNIKYTDSTNYMNMNSIVDTPSVEYKKQTPLNDDLDWSNAPIDLLAKIEVVPVIHAKWEEVPYKSVDQTGETYDDGKGLLCTNCKCVFKKDYFDWRWRYCPHCNARMDK